MGASRLLVFLGAVLIATAWLPVEAASAANSPTFRDCSFVGGIDPDFVQLSGATVDSSGDLTVTPAQNQVSLKASESSDPGDSSGHDTFTITVSAPGVSPKAVSGQATGHVDLTAPLAGAAVGSTYTISWSATFDNGNHSCPSSSTPNNTKSTPFVLHVVSNAPTPVPPTITNVRQSHRVWREGTARVGSQRTHQPPVGTKFSFSLNQAARVRFAFIQTLRGRKVTRGALSLAGHTGTNTVPFRGRIPHSKKLAPGRYALVITATNAAQQRSKPRSISFTIAG